MLFSLAASEIDGASANETPGPPAMLTPPSIDRLFSVFRSQQELRE